MLLLDSIFSQGIVRTK